MSNWAQNNNGQPKWTMETRMKMAEIYQLLKERVERDHQYVYFCFSTTWNIWNNHKNTMNNSMTMNNTINNSMTMNNTTPDNITSKSTNNLLD